MLMGKGPFGRKRSVRVELVKSVLYLGEEEEPVLCDGNCCFNSIGRTYARATNSVLHLYPSRAGGEALPLREEMRCFPRGCGGCGRI